QRAARRRADWERRTAGRTAFSYCRSAAGRSGSEQSAEVSSYADTTQYRHRPPPEIGGVERQRGRMEGRVVGTNNGSDAEGCLTLGEGSPGRSVNSAGRLRSRAVRRLCREPPQSLLWT